MQFTPGLGVMPFKNNSLHVKNIVGGFAGVTALGVFEVGVSVVSIDNFLDNVVISKSSLIVVSKIRNEVIIFSPKCVNRLDDCQCKSINEYTYLV